MATVNKTDLDNLRQELESRIETLDTFYLLVFGSIVMFLQCGFAFLEAGSVRSKNTSNILIKNLLDLFMAGLTYWVIGYALAYGEGNAFIGWTKWVSSGVGDQELASWFFQFVFAATAATIVSGAIAERCEFLAYLIYSFCITGIIYPIVTHWVWSDEGWLAKGRTYTIDGEDIDIGYQDFAGSGAVHVLGGVASFFGALIIGPRIGRFHADTGTVIPIRGHSVPFAALGGFILVFGFMAFNGGSQLAVSSVDDAKVVALAITNTALSGSAAAFVALLINKTKVFGDRTWSLLQTLNGCLAGMVASSATCNVLRPWAAVCCGGIAGLIYRTISFLMTKMKIDDPLDSVAVHFGGGMWGVISLAFFKWDDGILMAWDEKSGYMLAWQLGGLCSIIAWTAGLSGTMFGLMSLARILRVSPEVEKKGLDIFKHGEPAYPLESYGHGYLEQILTILEDGQLTKISQGVRNGGYESQEVNRMDSMISGSSNSLQSRSNGNLRVEVPADASTFM